MFTQDDVCNLLMQGRTIQSLSGMLVDNSVDLEKSVIALENISEFLKYAKKYPNTVEQFDHVMQSKWYMPEEYLNMDIAQYVLNLCNDEAELQRCGHELLMFQERNLFNLLKFLKYLVDTMTEHEIIWGVGRGSSVASFVLYKMGVHRVDSLFYELAPEEFLR